LLKLEERVECILCARIENSEYNDLDDETGFVENGTEPCTLYVLTVCNIHTVHTGGSGKFSLFKKDS
jgi:hypothetical protein